MKAEFLPSTWTWTWTIGSCILASESVYMVKKLTDYTGPVSNAIFCSCVLVIIPDLVHYSFTSHLL